MKLCWNRNAKARPTFIEIIDILLPDLDEERFEQVSFYHTVHKPLLLESQKEERQLQQQSINEQGQEMQQLVSSEHSHLHTHPHLNISSSHSHSAHILEVHPHLQRLFDKNSKFKKMSEYVSTGNDTADSSALSATTVTTGGLSSENSAGDSTQPIQFEESKVPSTHIVRYFPTRINGPTGLPVNEKGDSGNATDTVATEEDSSDVYVFTEPADSTGHLSAATLDKDKTEIVDPESGLGSSTMLNWPIPTVKCSDRVGDSSKNQLRARFLDQIEQPGEREKTDVFGSSTLSNGSVTALHQHRP
jgi:hypothetical protein